MDSFLVIVFLAAAAVFGARLVMIATKGPAKVADKKPPNGNKLPTSRAKPRQMDELPKATRDDEPDADLTTIRLPRLARIGEADDDALDSAPPVDSEGPSGVVPIVYDENADVDLATSSSACFLVSAVGQSEIGKRKRNEDSYLILDEPPLFVVADGMGGYRGGELASRMAVEALEHRLRDQAPSQDDLELPSRAAQLVEAVHAANSQIFAHAQEVPELSKMGTTLVAARFSPRKQRVYIAHVGDSRCYLWRRANLRQMTSDHTVGSMHKVKAPVASQLVRAVGVRPRVEVDLILGEPQAGDRYLLCSDGLTRMVDDDEIASILGESDEPAENVRALVEAARREGAKDNITVIVIKVEPIARGHRSVLAS